MNCEHSCDAKVVVYCFGKTVILMVIDFIGKNFLAASFCTSSCCERKINFYSFWV